MTGGQGVAAAEPGPPFSVADLPHAPIMAATTDSRSVRRLRVAAATEETQVSDTASPDAGGPDRFAPGAPPPPAAEPFPSADPWAATSYAPVGYPAYPPGFSPPPPRSSTGTVVALVVALVIAIPAMIVVGTFLVGAQVRALFAEEGEAPRDSQGQVTEAHRISTAKVRQGDCITDSGFGADPPGGSGPNRAVAFRAAAAENEVATVTVVPCSEPHEVQVYFSGELAGGAYPGETAVLNSIERSCRQEFERSIGLPLRDSELFASYYYPLEKSWAEDRGYSCVVSELGLDTTGSLLGARR